MEKYYELYEELTKLKTCSEKVWREICLLNLETDMRKHAVFLGLNDKKLGVNVAVSNLLLHFLFPAFS